jgi:hypothetical protein
VPPLGNRRTWPGARFENQERQPPLVQVGSGGQAHRSGTDHNNGQVIHGSAPQRDATTMVEALVI